MNILFISIYSERWGPRDELGIGYVASYLIQNGYNVKVVSLPDNPQKIEERLLNYLAELKPLLIGIGCSHTAIDINIYRLISSISKKYIPNTHITCGGYFASFNAQRLLLEWPELDSVVMGEGEEAALSLANSIRDKKDLTIEGIYLRDSGTKTPSKTVKQINDLDDLPFPFREIDGLPYSNMMSISTSRGCKAFCTFCNVPEFTKKFNKGWRGRSPKNIVEEMKYLHHTKKIERFSIVDSSFEDSNKNDFSRLDEFAELIIQNNLRISYYVFNRAETISNEKYKALLPKLIKSGLRRIFVGIESGLDETLDSFGKKASIENNVNAINIVKESGIYLRPGFIMLTPFSTVEGLSKNVSFLKNSGLLYSTADLLTRLELYNGSAEVTKIEKKKLLSENAWNNPYAYSFIDERIRPLADSFIEVRSDYSREFFWEALHMGHLISRSALLEEKIQANKTTKKIALQFHNEVLEYSNLLSIQNEKFMNECLDLANSKWNNKQFRKLTDIHIGGYQKEICHNVSLLTKQFIYNKIKYKMDFVY